MTQKAWKRLFVLLAVLALCLAGSGRSEAAKRIQLGSWNPGSGWYIYAAAMANIINNANVGVQMDALAKGGAIGNPINVSEGKYDAALTFSIAANWAYQGKVAYKKAYKNLRGLIGGMDEYYLGIVTTNPKVQKISDIKDKKIPVHYVTVPRGGLGQWATEAMLEAHGIKFDDIKKWGGSVTHTGFNVITSRIKDGQADMFSHTVNPGHPSLTQIAIEKKGQLRFLGVNDSVRNELAKIGFLKETMPANTFPGQTQPLPTFGFTTSMNVAASMDNETAYIIVKTLIDRIGELRASHKGLKTFKPEKTAWQEDQMGTPIHPGAARYYKEKGWLK